MLTDDNVLASLLVIKWLLTVFNVNVLRGDFLESRVFFAKTAQNLATKPSRKNALPPSPALKVFQKRQ